MDKFDRIHKLHHLFKAHRYPVSIRKIAESLEVSERVARKTITQMQDYLQAPIEYCSDKKGWQYDKTSKYFELPGIWLSAQEICSLTGLLTTIGYLNNSILNEEFTTIKTTLEQQLRQHNINPESLTKHIKVLPIANHPTNKKTFDKICQATLQQQNIKIHYSNYLQQQTQRNISPQTLIYYRETWYIDAWCHLRQQLRTFQLSRIEKITPSQEEFKKIEKKELEKHFSSSYGIFAGEANQIATLRFNKAIAHDIAKQQWHPKQHGEWHDQDYLLTFPYNDPRELMKDIMAHLPFVQVEQPDILRKAIHERIQKAEVLYKKAGSE